MKLLESKKIYLEPINQFRYLLEILLATERIFDMKNKKGGFMKCARSTMSIKIRTALTVLNLVVLGAPFIARAQTSMQTQAAAGNGYEVATTRSLKALTAALGSSNVQAAIEKAKAMDFLRNIHVSRARGEDGGSIYFEFAYGHKSCDIEVRLKPENKVPESLAKSMSLELSGEYYITGITNGCESIQIPAAP